MPADFFTEHTLGNLRQICENKAALFRLGMVGGRIQGGKKGHSLTLCLAIPHSERLVILMQFPSKSYLEQLRKKYPVGTKLQLISMRNETYRFLPGTVGEVTHIDDAGSIHMRWENGSSLALIPEIDSFQTVSEAKK